MDWPVWNVLVGDVTEADGAVASMGLAHEPLLCAFELDPSGQVVSFHVTLLTLAVLRFCIPVRSALERSAP